MKARTVVLGGGGSVGTAWQTGLLAAWARAGIDLSTADRIIGTSAGAGVGVQVALGQDLEQQLERYRVAHRRHAAGGETAVLDFDEDQAETVRLLYAEGHARGLADVSVRRRIADVATAAQTMPEEQFLRTFRYLRNEPWPTSYVCTTLDIDTAEFVALDHTTGGELDRGVAAAVAVPGVYPPIVIGGHRYVDGGCLSVTFLNLAGGAERVLFVAMTEVPQHEYDAVSDAELLTVRPDAESIESFGGDLMHAANAFPALESGLAQGTRSADQVATFWSS